MRKRKDTSDDNGFQGEGFGTTGFQVEGFNASPEVDEEPIDEPARELTDEIRSLRAKNKEFAATNEHDTYLVVSFSTRADRIAFLEAVGLQDEHTLIDGYALAKATGKGPTRPSFKLKAPISANNQKPQ